MKKIIAGLILATLPTIGGSTSIDLYGAYFKPGHPVANESLSSAVADSLQLRKLDETVETLRSYPEMKFEISGHVDFYECQAQECNELALRRALLVYHYLLDAGVNPRRITSLTEHSWSRPIAGTREDFAVNQRVEVNITQTP